MYRSPSPLSPESRATVGGALDGVLVTALDLHGQIKVAHWNVKGPHFAALHPLFETFAVSLATFADAVAERAVTLGAVVRGTARRVASMSTLPELPADAVRDLVLVELLADRFDRFLADVREARVIAERAGDTDTVDLLTGIVTEFEKNAWFLGAMLAT